MPKTLEPWPLVHSEHRGSFRIFDIRSDTKVSPRTKKELDFFVIECPHWVNVVALTSNRQVVMVEQYRHGSNTVELEIPGGMIDPEDPSPLDAGSRELLEETGYVGNPVRLIGEIYPNPAIMNNICHTALIEGCEYRQAPEWDAGEDIVTRLVDLHEIPGLMARGSIRHSLVVVALTHYLLQANDPSIHASP